MMPHNTASLPHHTASECLPPSSHHCLTPLPHITASLCHLITPHRTSLHNTIMPCHTIPHFTVLHHTTPLNATPHQDKPEHTTTHATSPPIHLLPLPHQQHPSKCHQYLGCVELQAARRQGGVCCFPRSQHHQQECHHRHYHLHDTQKAYLLYGCYEDFRTTVRTNVHRDNVMFVYCKPWI